MIFYTTNTCKKGLFLVIFLMILGVNAQSIRKDYREMTDYEKIELVNAFYQLREGADLVDDLANFHMDFFNFDSTIDPTRLDIHFNLPDEAERDIFFPWHRFQMFEMEQAIQAINPKISLAYWASPVDRAVDGPLWDEDFMGSFETNWSIGRRLGVLGDNEIITPANLTNLMAETDFHLFSNELERRRMHAGAHRWVGGPMATPVAPRDPSFYLHHSYVDKLWHDWETEHEGSFFAMTSMLRYDGTYVFDGDTLPSVNPNDIIDTRSLGVFYAEDEEVLLDNYIVSNTYNDEEYFYYQYLIRVGANFLAPENSKSRFESINEVSLEPGFTADIGAEIEIGIDPNTALAAKSINVQRSKKPFAYIKDLKAIVWEEDDKTDAPIILKAFPNPFVDQITISLNNKKDCKVEVYNAMGMLIRTESFQNTDTIIINELYGLSTGFYVVKLTGSDGEIIFAKRVVKL